MIDHCHQQFDNTSNNQNQFICDLNSVISLNALNIKSKNTPLFWNHYLTFGGGRSLTLSQVVYGCRFNWLLITKNSALIQVAVGT